MAIIEKGKNKYQLVYDYYVGEKRKRKTKIVECGIREAKKMYPDFVAECEASRDKSLVTVKQLLESYIDDCELRGLSVNTLRGYRICSKRLINSFGDVLAEDLTPYTIKEFICSQKELDPKTVANTISFLRTAYTFAIDMELLEKTPCNKVKLPKRGGGEKEILDENEITRFLECINNVPQDDKVAYLLALFGGLRRGEIQGLKEEDISDFNTISIVRTRYNKVIQLPKTDTSSRVIRLPKWVMDEIWTLIDQHDNHEYLIQYCNEPIKDWYLGDRMRRFREKYDFDITLHGLRHTFASMLIASRKFDIAEISKAMGHASITITLNTYAHLFKKASVSAKRIADYTEEYGTRSAHEALEAL